MGVVGQLDSGVSPSPPTPQPSGGGSSPLAKMHRFERRWGVHGACRILAAQTVPDKPQEYAVHEGGRAGDCREGRRWGERGGRKECSDEAVTLNSLDSLQDLVGRSSINPLSSSVHVHHRHRQTTAAQHDRTPGEGQHYLGPARGVCGVHVHEQWHLPRSRVMQLYVMHPPPEVPRGASVWDRVCCCLFPKERAVGRWRLTAGWYRPIGQPSLQCVNQRPLIASNQLLIRPICTSMPVLLWTRCGEHFCQARDLTGSGDCRKTH